MMSYPLIQANVHLLDKAKYPKLVAYTEMLEKHEGYVKSVKYIGESCNVPVCLLMGLELILLAEEVTGEKFKSTFR
jgi:hypothetical protein